MLCLTYEAVCDAKGVTLENMSERSDSLSRTLRSESYFSQQQFRVSTSSGKEVYSTLDVSSDQELLGQIDPLTTGYTIRRESKSDRVFIHYAGTVSLPDGALYMETVRDISAVFTARESYYQAYQGILMLVALIGGALIYVMASWVTRPIRSLASAATKMAGGDYSARASVQSRDEIGDLAQSFNHMAQEVERTIGDLEESARRQEDFTGSFVHELKTPLTSIIGYADILRSQDLSAQQRAKAAGYIFSEGKRLERLSLSLMDLLVAGHSGDLEALDMGKLCLESADSIRPAMEAKGLTLLAQGAPGELWGDPALLQTLVKNLLDNARKASESGGEVALTGEKLPEGYRLTVTDHGRGIPAGELDKITEAFYMVDKSRSRAEGGAGLGLALCKKIVAVHHGKMEFESREGQGTTVTVTLKGADHA
jgi:signal transduction histidine kinase